MNRKFLNSYMQRVANTIDPLVKVAYAMIRVSHLNLGNFKKASTADSYFNRAVYQHFKMEGLEFPPDLNWAFIFKRPVIKAALKYNLSKEREEDMMLSIFHDILMGTSLDTGGQWSRGNLAQVIRDFQAKGLPELDIQKLLLRQVHQGVFRNLRARQEGGLANPTRGYSDVGDSKDSDAILEILDLSPTSSGVAANFMAMAKSDPDFREILQMIDKVLSASRDPNVLLLWNTIKDSPDFSNLADLGRDEVTFKNPETRRYEKAPLYIAMGKKRPSEISYDFGKLQKILEHLKPHVANMLREKR